MAQARTSVVGFGAVSGYGWGVKALWDGLKSQVPATVRHRGLGGRFPDPRWLARVPECGDPAHGSTRYSRALVHSMNEAVADAKARGWSPGERVDIALGYARICAPDVRYYSAHATGTRECALAETVVLDHLGTRATAFGFKPLLGHTMGAAPMLDAVIYFWTSGRDFRHDDAALHALLQAGIARAFEAEDKPMIEAQQRVVGRTDLAALDPIPLSGDAGVFKPRSVLRRLIAQERGTSWSPRRASVRPLPCGARGTNWARTV